MKNNSKKEFIDLLNEIGTDELVTCYKDKYEFIIEDGKIVAYERRQ